MVITRGGIYWADLGPPTGSRPAKHRPVGLERFQVEQTPALYRVRDLRHVLLERRVDPLHGDERLAVAGGGQCPPQDGRS